MIPHPLHREAPDDVRALAKDLAPLGARTLVVGPWLHAHLLGRPAPRPDVEVHGADTRAAAHTFAAKVDANVTLHALPRDDPERWAEHRATARCTVDGLALDADDGVLLDPHGGCADLEGGRLCAVDPARFATDPLNALRVAATAARLDAVPDDALLSLCRPLDPSLAPAHERRAVFTSLLVDADLPSRGLECLAATGQLRHFPELAALDGVAQDPRWHPEGDVWTHTLMVVDAAATLRDPDDPPERQLALMLAALCHDLGKPQVTAERDGRVRALDHEARGEAPTRAFLARIGLAADPLVEQVVALVVHHLAPAQYPKIGASAKACRRLARTLEAVGADLALLERVARADKLGRTTDDALARRFPEGDAFLDMIRDLDPPAPPAPRPRRTVEGRDLIARGLIPGPTFATLLAECAFVAAPGRSADDIIDEVLARHPELAPETRRAT